MEVAEEIKKAKEEEKVAAAAAQTSTASFTPDYAAGLTPAAPAVSTVCVCVVMLCFSESLNVINLRAISKGLK